MDTGKNRIVGKNTKRALKSTLFAVLLSASLSLEGLAAMTADGPGAAYESAERPRKIQHQKKIQHQQKK